LETKRKRLHLNWIFVFLMDSSWDFGRPRLSKSDKRELKGNAKSKNLKNGNRLKEQQNPMEHKKPSNQRDKFVKNQPKFRQYGNQRYQNQEEEEEDVPDIKEELKKENPFVKYVQQKKQEKFKGKAQNAKQSDQASRPQNAKKRKFEDDEDSERQPSKSETSNPSKKQKLFPQATQSVKKTKNEGNLDRSVITQKWQDGAGKSKAENKSKLTPLQERLKAKLTGARFRWINEKLYTAPSQEAFEAFKQDPSLFDAYHEGFRNQVDAWPQNPLDLFIEYLQNKPEDTVVADFGCGEAKLAQSLHTRLKKIHSFDLVAANKFITACDISKVPLQDETVDIAIFCLSLMGTNFLDFVKEAYRVLKFGGELKIAEVISRFESTQEFIKALEQIGFKFKSKDGTNKMFMLMDFVKLPRKPVAHNPPPNKQKNKQNNKNQNNPSKKGNQVENKVQTPGEITAKPILKPCLYKRS